MKLFSATLQVTTIFLLNDWVHTAGPDINLLFFWTVPSGRGADQTAVQLSAQKRIFLSFPLWAALPVWKMVRKLILNISDLCSYGQVNSDMQQYTSTAQKWAHGGPVELVPTLNIWHHSEHLAPGGRWALTVQIVSSWKHLGYWSWYKLRALHREINSWKYSLRMGHLWLCLVLETFWGGGGGWRATSLHPAYMESRNSQI